MLDAARVLADAWIDPEVWRVHPDYEVQLVAATGLAGRPPDAASEVELRNAEAAAVVLLDGRPPEDLDEIAVWRAAYASMGLKPRVARSSVEALLRRCSGGLPRVDPLTDLYNALSVQHLVPIGGEDLDGYDGAPRLVLAEGTEAFDTVADGQATVQQADAGEVVWRDDAGVTCRRWNWRQCTRTRLTSETTRALFIVDGLGEGATERVAAAADSLEDHLHRGWPSAVVDRRFISRPPDH